jgi:hypothetical protein
VLVTSRNRLDDLDASLRVAIDTLPLTDAVTLLTRLAGEESGEAGELETLARSCGLLPLALRPVGALLTMLPAAELIEAMRTAERPLQHVPDADRAAEAAFTVSYEALTVPEQ